MLVACAWCIRDNRPAFMREVPPFTDGRVSHGCCAWHAAQWYEQLKAAAAALRANQERRSS